MKTHKFILLLWLLVFAGSYPVLAQFDSISSGLPDEEVIRLRNELVEAIESKNINSAKQIGDSLWSLQPSKGEYLSFYENYLCLYLFGEFNTILRNYPQNLRFKEYVTRYESIDNSLRFEVKKHIQAIFTKLSEDFELEEELVLSEFLLELLKTSDENNTNLESGENFTTNYGLYPMKKNNPDYSQWQMKGEGYAGNIRYHKKEETMRTLYTITMSAAAVSGVVALSSYLVADSKYGKYQNATTEADKYRNQVEKYDKIASVSTKIMIPCLTASLVFLVLESHFREKGYAKVNLYSDQNGIGILVRL